MSRKKTILAGLGTLAVAGLTIGGLMLNPQTPIQNNTDLLSVPVIVATSTPTPSATPTPTPKVSVAPSKMPKQSATPKPTETPVTLEVTEVTPAPIDTFALFGISEKITVSGTYSVKKIDSNKSEFSIVVPVSLSADMFELYLNRQFVDKQMLPNGKIIAPHLLFTAPELLEVRIIKLQQVIGIGRFENGAFTIFLKDGVIND